jgi:hypothetical protein
VLPADRWAEKHFFLNSHFSPLLLVGTDELVKNADYLSTDLNGPARNCTKIPQGSGLGFLSNISENENRQVG